MRPGPERRESTVNRQSPRRAKLALIAVVGVPAVSLSVVSALSGEAARHRVCIDVALAQALDPMPERGMLPGSPMAPVLGPHEDFPAASRLARIVGDDGSVLTGWHSLDAAGCSEPFDPESVEAVDVHLLPWAYWGAEALHEDTSVVAYDCRCCDAAGQPTGLCADDEAACGDEAAVRSCGRIGTRTLTAVLDRQSDTTLATLAAEAPHAALEASLWAAVRTEDALGHRAHQTSYVAISDAWSSNHADWGIGGHVTVYVMDRTPVQRFMVAHEYVHGMTVLASIPREQHRPDMIDCSLHGSCETQGEVWSHDHSFGRPEYQACALAEGMASFGALMAWYELEDGPTSLQPLLYGVDGPDQPIGCSEDECQDPSRCAGWVGVLCNPSDAACECDPQASCADRPGIAMELDWAAALLDFRTRSGVSDAQILGLLERLVADADAWPSPARANAMFWGFVDGHARDHFGSEHAQAWEQATGRWRVAK